MFHSNQDAGQTVYFVIVVPAIAAIIVYLVRAIPHKGQKPWPAFFVGIYSILMLLLFLFGMMTQVDSEGFGFLPLMVLTTPWSWIAGWLLKSTNAFSTGLLGGNLMGPIFFNLVTFLVPALANSCILYSLLKRREEKLVEDGAWEQARRNR
jgi:hypothetical protein